MLSIEQNILSVEQVTADINEMSETSQKVAIEQRITRIKGRAKDDFKCIFNTFEIDGIFGRNDISKLCEIYYVAGKIIVKLKDNELIKEVKGSGKGKHKLGYADKIDNK